jgi:tetratricopeptide (TPR) repeat protein
MPTVVVCFTVSPLLEARPATPQIEGRKLQVDQQQVRRWNQFAEGLYSLHEARLKDREVETTETLGGYSGRPAFYRQVSYFDAKDKYRLSRLQWERENPENLHLIEIFEHDSKGRVSVDYLAAFLPDHRNAPVQTLVNLHNYHGELHAFRQFDASGRHIYEQCKGRFQDEPVFLSLEEHELSTPEGLPTPVMSTALYKACFGGLPMKADDALRRVFAAAGAALPPQASLDDRTDTVAMQRLERLNRRLFSEPDNAVLYVLRGDVYRELNQHEKAVHDYTQAITLDSAQDGAYFGRGMVYGRAGQLDEAVADLSVFIERNPRSSLAYTKRGVRYIWMGELEQAQRDLQRAIELNYRNAEAHDDLGVIFAQQGELSKALHQFEIVLTLEPGYQKGYHNKALVLYTGARHKEALSSINNALALDPENRNSLLLKAAILEALGHSEQAKTIAEHAEFLPEGNWTERFAVE